MFRALYLVFKSKLKFSTTEMAEFTNTKRGARCLHLNGYQYTLNKRGHNGNQYWRCVDRSCPGRATLVEDDSVVSENNNHNHPPNPLQVTVSKTAGKAHPNFFELVELFQNEQAMTEVTLQQLAAGGATRKRERRYRMKDRAIKRVQQKFEAGTYSIDEYIDQISKWMGFL